MKSSAKFIAAFLAAVVVFGGCEKDEPTNNPTDEQTETVVSENLIVYEPAEGTAAEENIIEYIPNRKIVFKVPSAANAPQGKMRSVSANSSKMKVVQYTTQQSTDFFPGMCISIPPNTLVPDGGLLKITEVEYGAGSVIVWGEQANMNDVLLSANIDSKISFFDNFNKTSFTMPTTIEGLTLSVTCDKITDKKTISIAVTATYNLLKNESAKEPDKSGTTSKLDIALTGALELRNVELQPRIVKAKEKIMPDVCDFTLSGELNASVTLAPEVNIKEELGKTFRVGEIPLGAIPIAPGLPIYISPKLVLDITLGAKGSLKWSWKCLDYTYPFSFAAGYYKGDWYAQGNESKGYFTYHTFPAIPDIKGSIYEDIKLGLAVHFMDWEGVEALAGGGFKPTADFKYTAAKQELEIDLNAPLYAFCDFKLNTLFGTALKWSAERQLVTWHLWDGKFTVEASTPYTPETATYTAAGVSFDMIAVPGGTFQMGSTDGDSYSNEQPVHTVTLSDFAIGKYEVTQALWFAVMGKSLTQIAEELGWSTNGVGDNFPMYDVSWNDIVGTGSTTGYTVNGIDYKTDGFCYKLSQLVGGGTQFCLPTEAQWEYAARGGQQTNNYTYSGSNTVGDVAWYYDNSGSKTHPVGTKSPNELGIYDMSGNVVEWSSDWYGSYSSGSQTNPRGASTGSSRVFRGGGWDYDARLVRVSNRYGITPGNRGSILGFRLASSSN
ncbi:MAG: formylglycine-generating enzyme family protein [Candidatus Symbiothrix sp.]|nr:formylglycine-generating enzyme family protein [Candidatus Symbiothrix sp.]